MLYGEPLFTHDLPKLMKRAAELCGEEPPDRVKDCVYMLDKMYTPPRYPDAFPEGAPWEHYTEREALEAKRCAEEVLGWVEGCASRAIEEAGEEKGAG